MHLVFEGGVVTGRRARNREYREGLAEARRHGLIRRHLNKMSRTEDTMSKAWAKGSSRAWRRTRIQVLARDGYRCQLQLPGCTSKATEVHHTAPREVAGDDPAHLLAACSGCNKRAGDPRRTDPKPRPRTRW